MNVLLIGGVERRETDLCDVATRAGHSLAYHGGDVGGRGALALRSLIERSDMVVFQTAINSHGSMYIAKRLARQLDKTFVVVRKCGPARLETLLVELNRARRARNGDLPAASLP